MASKKINSIENFTGGINVYDDPWAIQTSQSPYTKNAFFSRSGGIEKRTGFSVVSEISDEEESFRGMMKFIKTGTGGFEKLVLVHKKKIFSFDKNFVLEEIGSDAMGYLGNGKETVRGCSYENVLYFGDGENNNKKWDGTTLSEYANSPRSDLFLNFGGFIVLRDSNNKRVLKYPDPDDPEDFSGGNSGMVTPAGDEGGIIKGVTVFQNRLICFKEDNKIALPLRFDSENFIVGFGQEEFDDGNDGAVSPSLLHIANAIYFLGKKGLQMYGMQENFPDRRSTKGNFSFVIKPLIDSISDTNAENTEFVEYDNLYLASVPLNGSMSNNAVLVYDNFYTGFGLWDLPVRKFQEFYDESGERKLFFTHSTEPKICMLNDEYIDYKDGKEEKAIDFVYRTKTFKSWGKRMDTVRIEGEISENSTTTVKIMVDDQVSEFSISDSNISEKEKSSGIVGGFGVGEGFVGGGSVQRKKRFKKTCQFPHNINQGKEMAIEIQNKNIGEYVKITGLYFSDEIIFNRM